MLYRIILPSWAQDEHPQLPKVREGEFTPAEIQEFNEFGYNIYSLPNHPSKYNPGVTVDGTHIDVFEYVYVDMDLKEGKWADKQAFLEAVMSEAPEPSRIVDSGGGIHVYWRVTDLDAMSFLKLQRRLCRRFKTDEAVAKIYQLMRVPGTANTKDPENLRLCEEIYTSEATYTCEFLDSFLPKLTADDAKYCDNHYNKTYNKVEASDINDELPAKFGKLLKTSAEAREIWKGGTSDRSKSDWRLACIMLAEGFSRDEALSVLVNCQKALERAPVHRHGYAIGIVDKVWTEQPQAEEHLSSSVSDIVKRNKSLQGTRIRCWEVYDGTNHGFRLTEVLGLIGGAGSGKTTLALNYFYWFTKQNPEYIHLFVSLEQPEEEIARRWVRMVGDNENLHKRVHVLGNYNKDGTYRNLSLTEIENYIIELEGRLKCKVGCVVIDHIGVLKKKGPEGEAQGLIDICHTMKAFAKRTDTFLVMQSQTSREKAGEGDLELNKDAAYGTSMFEWYCDYVVTTWQPLKRVYPTAPHMTCSAFKYCKIRHKNVMLDHTKEDAVHVLMFDTNTEILREMNEKDEIAYSHFNSIATSLRNKDRKKEPTKISKIDWVGIRERIDGAAENSKDQQ